MEDLGELFDVELPADEVETVGGLLAQALGRVPIPGAEAEVGGLRLVAEGTTGRRNRIDTVLVRRVEPSDARTARGAASTPSPASTRTDPRRGNPPMPESPAAPAARPTPSDPAELSAEDAKLVTLARAARGPGRRRRGRGGARPGRPHLRRRPASPCRR